jgi:hypothetical protein
MKVVTVLKLQDLYKLETELNGLTNPENGEILVKGLLFEEIPFTTKFWLSKLSEHVSKEKQSISKHREDLIRKYGQEDEKGNVTIPLYSNEDTKEPNPSFIAFQNDFNLLLNEDYELEHNGFKLKDFENVKSENNYQIFYKLIKVDE